MRAGEIFGVAGVAGNGQNELLSALSGETLAPEPESVILSGEAIGRLGVTERRSLGLCAVPEERNGHAAVGEFSLSDNASLTGRDRMDFVSFGLIDPGQGDDLRRRCDRRLHRQGHRAECAGGLAVRRQPAEVHHGAGDPAAPRGAGRLPADLGRRRGRGGGHPSGDRRSRGARLGGARHLPGPRRAPDAHATRSRSSISAGSRSR